MYFFDVCTVSSKLANINIAQHWYGWTCVYPASQMACILSKEVRRRWRWVYIYITVDFTAKEPSVEWFSELSTHNWQFQKFIKTNINHFIEPVEWILVLFLILRVLEDLEVWKAQRRPLLSWEWHLALCGWHMPGNPKLRRGGRSRNDFKMCQMDPDEHLNVPMRKRCVCVWSRPVQWHCF